MQAFWGDTTLPKPNLHINQLQSNVAMNIIEEATVESY